MKKARQEKNCVKKTRIKKKALRFLFFGVSSVAVTIYFFALVLNMSLEIASKYAEKDKLEADLNQLKEEEQELSTDVLKLQDPEYVARYLRERFYYSKANEYIIKLPAEK